MQLSTVKLGKFLALLLSLDFSCQSQANEIEQGLTIERMRNAFEQIAEAQDLQSRRADDALLAELINLHQQREALALQIGRLAEAAGNNQNAFESELNEIGEIETLLISLFEDRNLELVSALSDLIPELEKRQRELFAAILEKEKDFGVAKENHDALLSEIRELNVGLRTSLNLVGRTATDTPKRAEDPLSKPAGRVADQLGPFSVLPEIYGKNTRYLSFVALVSDPRVPRLRRNFDLMVEAITRAHTDRNYVQDRYYFPWMKDEPFVDRLPSVDEYEQHAACAEFRTLLLTQFARQELSEFDKWALDFCTRYQTRTEPPSSAGSEPQNACQDEHRTCEWRATRLQTTRQKLSQLLCYPTESSCLPDIAENRRTTTILPSKDFGIMTFRKDLWRENGSQSESSDYRYEVIAVYLVADRPSAGVNGNALLSAITYSQAHQTLSPLEFYEQIVIGPTTSGGLAGLDPVGEIFQKANQRLSLCNQADHPCLTVIAPHTTAEKNRLFAAESPYLQLRQLAGVDKDRIERIVRSVTSGQRNELARSCSDLYVLSENSTWGSAFSQALGKRCAPNEPFASLTFPRNLFEIYATTQTQESDLNGSLPQIPDFSPILKKTRELSLGWDQGAEFPNSYSTATTSRSLELVLGQKLTMLERLVNDRRSRVPTFLILATDVRDKLFMARSIRSRFPNGQLVVPEADSLLTHPDYLDATRGLISLTTQDWEYSAFENKRSEIEKRSYHFAS
ncbi:MAG: hypothetical protein AAF358_08835 [Pseudomonadota bacterium]